jgi:uncharacterized membrane protein
MAHGHGHGHSHRLVDPVEVPVLSRVVLLLVLLVVALGAGYGMYHYWPNQAAVREVATHLQYSAPGVTFPQATIDSIDPTCAAGTQGDQVCATFQVTLDSGKKITVQTQGPNAESGLVPGDRIQLMAVPDSAGGPTAYSFNGVERSAPLLWLLLAFLVVVLAVAWHRGLFALIGLGLAGTVLAKFMLPALVTGEPAVVVSLIAATVIMYVVLYLAHGPSIRTSTALAGTLGGVGVTALVALWAVSSANLSGVGDDQGALLSSALPNLDFRVLLTAAIIIAGLGVLNDVTITQASAVWELRGAGPELSRLQLFTSAMRIGRDHIASTIYTIVFAYAGAAMSVLLVLFLYNRPLLELLSTESIATEVVRTMCSAIGLVLAVPITTAISALMVVGPRPAERHVEMLPREPLI